MKSRTLTWITAVTLFAALALPARLPAQLLPAEQNSNAKSTLQVGNCKGRTGFPTISAAISAASSGGLILVCPGSYPEQIVITKPLTLTGIQDATRDQAVILPPYRADAKRGATGSSRLMTMPLAGGTPAVLARGDYQYQCARPSSVCVLSEEKGQQLDFYFFDPRRGPEARPFKSTGELLDWSLSPDGKRIALIEEDDASQLKILALTDGATTQLNLGRWTQLKSQLQSVAWFVDGKGLYVTAFLPSGTTLLSVSLDGKVTTLFQQGRNWLCCPAPAPNGRSLGFSATAIQRDVALVENF